MKFSGEEIRRGYANKVLEGGVHLLQEILGGQVQQWLLRLPHCSLIISENVYPSILPLLAHRSGSIPPLCHFPNRKASSTMSSQEFKQAPHKLLVYVAEYHTFARSCPFHIYL